MITFQDAHEFQFFHAHNCKAEVGSTSIAFLSRLCRGSVSFQELITLNGYCKYKFIQDAGGICGVLFNTPTSITRLSPTHVVVGHESDDYKPIYNLQPQGIIIMESGDSNTILMSKHIHSPLLVKVDTAER
jgi:hypothetical protein